ncbi:MAG TPA: hypothetical protein VGK02_03455 [Candidatus Aquicultor sp.]|jgi:hypothetical protein
MKKGLVILMAIAMLFAMSTAALAVQEENQLPGHTNALPGKGNIVANTYTPVASDTANPLSVKDYKYYEQGLVTTTTVFAPYGGGNGLSTHVYGTWNSPYTMGIDGYNYNDSQDYVETGKMAGTAAPKTFPINPYFLNAITNMFTGYGMSGMLVDTNSDGVKESVATMQKPVFQSGPHGGYLTSTHRCRECHAVHRAAGKFKLLRSDTRFEACDWCHGTGAGSGYNIQMDNNDLYTEEYNVGHTMGYGIDSGKWKAPDDTYPAFTPNYYMGGFSCFDCHSPHANPARMIGFDANGEPIQSIVDLVSGNVYNIGNPGHDMFAVGGKGFAQTSMDPADPKLAWVPALGGPLPNKAKPYYLAGSWLLIKDPDKEIASRAYTNVPVDVWSLSSAINGLPSYTTGALAPFAEFDSLGASTKVKDANVDIAAGAEIPDSVYSDGKFGFALNEFDATKSYPVNKVPINWNTPIGSAAMLETTQMFGFGAQSVTNPLGMANPAVTFDPKQYGYNVRNPFCKSVMIDEFCTDCHDGNAGLSTVAAPLFSEDRALRGQTVTGDNTGNSISTTVTGNVSDWKGSYDIGYGHDESSRHCGRTMEFNPEDGYDMGPKCRNCHKGSTGCGACHNDDPTSPGDGVTTTTASAAADNHRAGISYLFAEMFAMGNQADPGNPMFSWATPSAVDSYYRLTTYDPFITSTGLDNQMAQVNTSTSFGGLSTTANMYKNSRTVDWSTTDWRASSGVSSTNAACSDDGLSWPHRTLGWKMLKDDLFGIDPQGVSNTAGAPRVITAGQARTGVFGNGIKAHDLDSVCLDCHNPTVWGATSTSNHTDDINNPADNMNDELLLRGLP